MICSLTDLHTGHFYLHRDGFFGAAFLTMMSNLSAGTSIINMYHEDIPVLLDSCLGLPMLSLFQRCEHRGPHISIPKSVPDPSHWAFTTEVLRCARSVLGEPCQASPPPPICGLLNTRKQGPYPAPFRCGVWQLIFFCRIRVGNLHFHVGIPLRPVLNPPAVQTGWLIKGILFVKQSLTSLSPSPSLSLSCHLFPSLPFTSSICTLFILAHPLWVSPPGPSKELFFGKTTEKRVCILLALRQIPPKLNCTLGRATFQITSMSICMVPGFLTLPVMLQVRSLHFQRWTLPCLPPIFPSLLVSRSCAGACNSSQPRQMPELPSGRSTRWPCSLVLSSSVKAKGCMGLEYH